jgi:Tfp pilus assembly protein PilF
MAYSNLAQLRMLDHDLEGTLQWGERAIALAAELGEIETLAHALNNVGSARSYADDDRGYDDLVHSLDLAMANGLYDHASRALVNLAYTSFLHLRLDEAEHRLLKAIAFAADHDLDFRRGYLQATRAALYLRRGNWDAAEAEITELWQHPMLSSITRMMALTTQGQIFGRRGQPAAAATLDEALSLAERSGKLLRLWPVRAARAEMALLQGDTARARQEAEAAKDVVISRGNRWDRGELVWLLWQAGVRDFPAGDLAEPYALQIGGTWEEAAADWQELGCPYEAAVAMAASDDPGLVQRAIATFES